MDIQKFYTSMYEQIDLTKEAKIIEISENIPSKNFHNEKWSSDEREQSRKIDKLWDDLTEGERSEITHVEKIYGDFYPNLQSDQEKSFYEWKQKNDGFVNQTVHDNL